MSAVLHCYTITKKLKEAIEKLNEENRETTIEEIDSLLEKRQQLLGTINPPFSAEEQSLGKQMITLNKEIDSNLLKLRAEVKRDMNNLNKKKESAQKYRNPFESMQYDGMFYDKKK
ncbi:flagellar protein FliT [Rossellomorea sp. DA94]|uniref:flagellar protein FliT n=1 Tax=Rossellomorea sp. DA94 TaxID=3038653 RepID=UPI002447DAB8|nr:flagellar protein FliT [Rossellomorea sp. DA94]WGG45220.1 flagellar protein FliT [Rossellomorea sp. DA94]